MSYSPRKRSEGDVYHVMARGVGRQIIFESDRDRMDFITSMKEEVNNNDMHVLAWCLMDNHVHLLLRSDLSNVSRFMKLVLARHARRFNLRHDRVGHLFQDRFSSEPVGDEAYLLGAVRYIHQNPEKANIAPTSAYWWSSYREYVDCPQIIEADLVLALLGSAASFVDFHKKEERDLYIEEGDTRDDAIAKRTLRVAIDTLGEKRLHEIRTLSKAERDRCIVLLRDRGLSVRQIERLTGIGRNIISRVDRDTFPRSCFVSD